MKNTSCEGKSIRFTLERDLAVVESGINACDAGIPYIYKSVWLRIEYSCGE